MKQGLGTACWRLSGPVLFQAFFSNFPIFGSYSHFQTTVFMKNN